MGFGDKLKGLKDQAQQAVADNKDKIQGAVQVAGDTANAKTRGKYAGKIMKVGEKVEASVDKFAEGAAPADAEPAAESSDPAHDIEGDAPPQEASDAPVAHEPQNPVTPSAADAAKSGFPEFE